MQRDAERVAQWSRQFLVLERNAKAEYQVAVAIELHLAGQVRDELDAAELVDLSREAVELLLCLLARNDSLPVLVA